MRIRNVLITAVLLGLIGPGLSSPTHADSLFRANSITFNKPVRLPGVMRVAGSYLFETSDPKGRGLVSVLSHDRRQVYFTGLTTVVPRPRNTSLTQTVSFGETVSSAPARISVWWETGESFGHQFYYPSAK